MVSYIAQPELKKVSVSIFNFKTKDTGNIAELRNGLKRDKIGSPSALLGLIGYVPFKQNMSRKIRNRRTLQL